MVTTTITGPTAQAFSGPVWYQETYFLDALQQEIDGAKNERSALSIVVLRVAGCSRRAAHTLFAYAEAENGRSFFGLLSNGDYAICMSGRGYTEAARERVTLERLLRSFDVYSGLAVLDEESTAAELLSVATRECNDNIEDGFGLVAAA